MLAGNLTSIIAGGAICVLVSWISGRGIDVNDDEVWQNTRDIDNPLSPWAELYARYMYT